MDSNTPIPSPASDKNDPDFKLGPPSRTGTGTRSLISAVSKPRTNVSSLFVTKEVKKKVGKESPGGQCCLVTRDTEQLDCCHVIERVFDPKNLPGLAVAWGCEKAEIEINGHLNLLWLRKDVHGRFDNFDWALVPQMEILEKMFAAKDMKGDSPVSKNYLQFFEDKAWEYDFVPFRRSPPAILRFGDSPDDYTVHKYPFPELKPVKSHVNPFFVVYDAGRKARYHRKTPVPDTNILPQYRAQLRLCQLIYREWTKQIVQFWPPENHPINPPSATSEQQRLERNKRARVGKWKEDRLQ